MKVRKRASLQEGGEVESNPVSPEETRNQFLRIFMSHFFPMVNVLVAVMLHPAITDPRMTEIHLKQI